MCFFKKNTNNNPLIKYLSKQKPFNILTKKWINKIIKDINENNYTYFLSRYNHNNIDNSLNELYEIFNIIGYKIEFSFSKIDYPLFLYIIYEK